jgi:hypothetical protein
MCWALNYQNTLEMAQGHISLSIPDGGCGLSLAFTMSRSPPTVGIHLVLVQGDEAWYCACLVYVFFNWEWFLQSGI